MSVTTLTTSTSIVSPSELSITLNPAQTLQRPIPNSYWATPFLLACEYPWCPSTTHAAPKLDSVLRAGIRTFIDLTESGELCPYTSLLPLRAALLGIDAAEIEYHRFPIRDRSLPISDEYTYSILKILQENEERGRKTAVHCRGGIGRTGLIIGCYLIQSGRAKDGLDALCIIGTHWKNVQKCNKFPHSPETGPQFEYVRGFRKRGLVM